MSHLEDALRMRIYLGSARKAGYIPLYEAIVLKAREFGLAGATAFRSPPFPSEEA
jgi:PII-like signaling protein